MKTEYIQSGGSMMAGRTHSQTVSLQQSCQPLKFSRLGKSFSSSHCPHIKKTVCVSLFPLCAFSIIVTIDSFRNVCLEIICLVVVCFFYICICPQNYHHNQGNDDTHFPKCFHELFYNSSLMHLLIPPMNYFLPLYISLYVLDF